MSLVNAKDRDMLCGMPRLKKIENEKRKLVKVRMNEDERSLIQEKADQFCDGNFSAWVRYSAIHYKPRASELEKEKP